MTDTKETIRYKLGIEGKVIEQIMHFNYLSEKVKTQTCKTTRVAGCL